MPPGRQRKFELIPTTLVKSNGPKPPMTSKAAKKAYQKANQGPKVSRAEQRRLDREELERQRKEYEKERASEKARAAREKKALKAEAERSERRKLGIPEPSRFVRASQPTISRFVKGNGKRVWQEMDVVAEESEGTIYDDDLQHGLKSLVKQSTTGDEGNVRDSSPTTKSLTKCDEGPSTKRAAIRLQPDSDSEPGDEFRDFPSLSPSPLLDEKHCSLGFLENGPIPSDPMPESKAGQQFVDRGSPQLPRNRIVRDELMTDSQEIADLANTQLLSEAAEEEVDSDHNGPPVVYQRNQVVQQTKQPQIQVPLDELSTETYRSRGMLSPPALQNRSFNMPPPPPRHITVGRQSLDASKPAHARIAPQNNGSRFPKLPDLPPPSTQAFLENNLAEFLPSPSQELRELLSDGEDLPLNNPVLSGFGSAKPDVGRKPWAVDDSLDFDTLICTQDLILSSQDLEELSPEKNKSRQPPLKTTNDLERSNSESCWEFFPSTQDLTLSAQDLEEIETPSRVSRSNNNNVHREVRRMLREATGATTTKNRPNDTKESSARDASQNSRPRRPLEEKVNNQSRANPRQKTRFFEEKEEDLYQAALHESRLIAQKPTQKVPLRSESTVRFEAGTAKKREKRTLQRSQSAATDYGDDEFAGFSEQELAALC